MDLRIVKTKKAIREAYLNLREKSEPDKIKVVDLCALALINKTTFYKYYQDIFALADEIDAEIFKQFWRDFEAKDQLFSNTEKFINELPGAFDKNGKAMTVLFSNRYDMFFSMLENQLMGYYLSVEIDRKEQIRKSFVIRGIVQTLKDIKINRTWTMHEAAVEIADVVRKI